MEKDITQPILSGGCDSGDSKRVRMADPESTVGGESRPVKLPKIEENGIDSTIGVALISHMLFFYNIFIFFEFS